jgi:hypothetical protein
MQHARICPAFNLGTVGRAVAIGIVPALSGLRTTPSPSLNLRIGLDAAGFQTKACDETLGTAAATAPDAVQERKITETVCVCVCVCVCV